MRTWMLLLASTALALGAAELAVRGLDLFAEPRAALAEARRDAPPDARATPFGKQLHPFRGWTVRPGAPPKPGHEHPSRRNLLGFMSTLEDYRDVPEQDFAIGIFGGSVAAGVATWGAEAIETALVRARPELAAKVRILNFGSGAYKQPQQLMTLSEMILLGVPLDFVVNLDGLNEVALGLADARAGHHPIFPSRPQLKGLADLARGAPSDAVLDAHVELRKERRAAQRIVDASWIDRSELAQAVGGALLLRSRRREAALEAQLQAQVAGAGDGVLAALPDACLETAPGCMELIADIWLRASRLMAAQAASIGAGYLHALQPSQYVPDSKRFTEREAKRAVAPHSLWAAAVRSGYPLLQARGAALGAAGVDFLDLTDAYRKVAAPIYTDVCCHTNVEGYRILGERIGARVAEAF